MGKSVRRRLVWRVAAIPALVLVGMAHIPAAPLGEYWIAAHRGARADLHGVMLTGANLEGVNLIGARLRGANLTRANLRGANLWNADLSGANLSLANLRKANLGVADLHGAFLGIAHLEGADLRGADLRGAVLSNGCDWSEPILTGAVYDKSTRWPTDLPNNIDPKAHGAVEAQ